MFVGLSSKCGSVVYPFMFKKYLFANHRNPSLKHKNRYQNKAWCLPCMCALFYVSAFVSFDSVRCHLISNNRLLHSFHELNRVCSFWACHTPNFSVCIHSAGYLLSINWCWSVCRPMLGIVWSMNRYQRTLLDWYDMRQTSLTLYQYQPNKNLM